jgi:hypothetical protein
MSGPRDQPTCPKCGASMVRRTRRRDGAAFLGCPEGLEHGDIISRGAVRVLAVHELHATGHRLWSLPAVAVRSVSIRPMLSSALSPVRRAPRERPR